jgi:maltose O-acetyltransferase
MTQKQRMLAELPYRADQDGLEEERLLCKQKVFAYNNTPPEQFSTLLAQLQDILGDVGTQGYIEPPFHCDYGWNIQVGENFYANYNLTILDVGKVTIGKNAFFGPNVSIYTAGHPIHPDSRNSGYEYGIGITIGDNCWIGGNTVILPGVTIGDNCVVGAGSVVTHHLPPNTISVGNPCRVLRQITPEDRDYFFQKRRFDVSDY